MASDTGRRLERGGRLGSLGFAGEMLRAAAACAVLAISLGGCDDSDSKRSALYHVQPSVPCFKTLAPSQPPYVPGWRVLGQIRADGNLGQTVHLTHIALLTHTRGAPVFSPVNYVDVFFAKSETVAKARFDRLFEDAQVTGHPRRRLQRRSNVVLIWTTPATAREIATVTRCLRKADK